MNNNSMSRKSHSTTQACAACKHQRRKCGPNCILAPYFPHDRQKQFLNAHKLFGVGKINDIIKPLDPAERDIAMSTIIFQSDMRANDPVGGCYRYIQQLQSHIEYYNAELQIVLQHLAIYKAQAQQQHVQNQQHVYHPTKTYATVNVDGADPLTLYNSTDAPMSSQYYLQQVPLHYQYETSISNNIPPLQEDVNGWIMQNSMQNSMSSLSLQEKNANDNIRVDNDGYVYDQKPI